MPKFETPRLLLRGIDMGDVPSYQKHFVDWEVIRNLAAHVPWPYPDNGVAEYVAQHLLPTLEKKDRWFWGIFLKTNPGEMIGGVELWRPGKPENRGFWLGRKFWGQGYMTEAVAPVMDYAFNELGFEKLVFANALGNTKSRRVKEKTGARLLHVVPAKFVDPQFTEHEIWELSKGEWLAHKGK